VWVWAVDLDPAVGSPLFLSPQPEPTSPFPPCVATHPFVSLGAAAPSHLLLPQALATATTLAAPYLLLFQGSPFPAWIYVALVQVSNWNLVEGRRMEERGRIQGDFVIIFCLFVLQFN
jgi:hypothetical protein